MVLAQHVPAVDAVFKSKGHSVPVVHRSGTKDTTCLKNNTL
jgi:hypothetical protein